MGLDTSHDAWHGPYSMFSRWRVWIAQQIGIPLGLMQGFYQWTWEEGDLDFDANYMNISRAHENHECGTMYWETLKGMQELGRPVTWDILNGHPLKTLLHHSDCDGRIKWWDCKAIAIELGKILRAADDDTKDVKYRDGPNAGQSMFSSWRDGKGIYDGNVPATKRFIRGCLEAYRNREDMIFR